MRWAALFLVFALTPEESTHDGRIQIEVHDLVFAVIATFYLGPLLILIFGDQFCHYLKDSSAVAVESSCLFGDGLAEPHCPGRISLAGAHSKNTAVHIDAVLHIARIPHILQHTLGKDDTIGVDEHIGRGVHVDVDDGQGDSGKINNS